MNASWILASMIACWSPTFGAHPSCATLVPDPDNRMKLGVWPSRDACVEGLVGEFYRRLAADIPNVVVLVSKVECQPAAKVAS